MKHPLSDFLGDDAQKLRLEAEARIKVDVDGNPVLELVHGDDVSLSATGTIRHLKYVADRFHPCNCSAQEAIGGRCGEKRCGRINCHRCFKKCQSCQIGLCVIHQRVARVGDKTVVLCDPCLGQWKRKRLLRAAAGLFVKLEEPKEL